MNFFKTVYLLCTDICTLVEIYERKSWSRAIWHSILYIVFLALVFCLLETCFGNSALNETLDNIEKETGGIYYTEKLLRLGTNAEESHLTFQIANTPCRMDFVSTPEQIQKQNISLWKSLLGVAMTPYGFLFWTCSDNSNFQIFTCMPPPFEGSAASPSVKSNLSFATHDEFKQAWLGLFPAGYPTDKKENIPTETVQAATENNTAVAESVAETSKAVPVGSPDNSPAPSVDKVQNPEKLTDAEQNFKRLPLSAWVKTSLFFCKFLMRLLTGFFALFILGLIVCGTAVLRFAALNKKISGFQAFCLALYAIFPPLLAASIMDTFFGFLFSYFSVAVIVCIPYSWLAFGRLIVFMNPETESNDDDDDE